MEKSKPLMQGGGLSPFTFLCPFPQGTAFTPPPNSLTKSKRSEAVVMDSYLKVPKTLFSK
jgi:hypothetical protein